MTSEAVTALRARATAIDFASFDEAPSGLAGWSRLDVLRHLTDLCERVVGPARRPDRTDDTVVRADAGIAAMRTIDAEEVGIRHADAFGVMTRRLDQAQVPVSGDLLVHFGTAGQHPTHLWADGLVYEHVVHAGIDLGVEAWEPSDGVVGPAVGWIVSSLPQVNANALRAALTDPMGVSIGAPIEVDMTLWGVGDGVAIGTGIAPSARAVVSVTPAALIGAVSGRRRWVLDGSTIGDDTYAERVLDEMRI